MTGTISIDEAQRHLSELLEEAAGEEVVITKDGVAVAVLMPVKSRCDDAFGLWGHHQQVDGLTHQRELRGEW